MSVKAKKAALTNVQRSLEKESRKVATQAAMAAVEKSLQKRDSARLKQETALLLSFVLPKETDPIRVGSLYGSAKTAVAPLFRKEPVVAATGDGDLPASDVCCFAFRDALRSFISTYGMTAIDSYIYQNNSSFRAVTEVTTYPLYKGPLFAQPTPVGTTRTDIHGPALYAGRLGSADPYRGFLLNSLDILTVRFTARPAIGVASSYVVEVVRQDGAVWTAVDGPQMFCNQIIGGVIQYQAPETGYYAFRILTQYNGGAASVEIGLIVSVHRPVDVTTDASNFWSQLPLPRIEENLEALRSYRIPSVSVMYTNTAAPIYRPGQLAGVQLPRKSSWLEYIEYDSVANATAAESFDIVEGMYGFLKPSSAADLDMRVFQYPLGDGEFEYVFDLLPRSDYLVIHAQINMPEGRQGIFTPAHHLEFTTLSLWFSSERPETDERDFEAAMRMLSDIPPWHHNETHLADVWNFIKAEISSLWGGVKEVADTLAPYIPLAVAAAVV